MTGRLLVRGMLVGIIAGLLAFGFAKVFGEPQVDLAIAFEEGSGHMHGATEEPELVSRSVQGGLGLLTGVMVYSISLGGIFALVFAYSLGRIGKVGPRGLAALLALAAFVTVFAVPGLVYPPNPPSVGSPDTIGQRTKLFFLMVLVSVAAAVIAINAGRTFIARSGLWNGAIKGVAVYLLIVGTATWLFPTINEVPEHFSPVLLWKFRVAAFGIQLVLWSSLGLIFGVVAERLFYPQGKLAQA